MQKALKSYTVIKVCKKSVWIPFFGTFLRNKILDEVPKFQGKMSSCSKVMKCGKWT